MADDLISRIETALACDPEQCGWRPFVVELLAALKAEQRKLERLRKYVTRHSDLCICDKAGLGHYDGVSCKVHADG